MASDEPSAATVIDPDGREVVLLARIWEDKIARDHPELVDHLEAVMETVAKPVHVEAGRASRQDAVLPAWRRSQPLADGGRKL
jgi:hypothetical protein